MKQLIFLLCAIIIAAISLYLIRPSPPPSESLPRLRVKDQVLAVEIADTVTLRYQGLSNRAQMDEMQGMYFVFDTPIQTGFVMRDMLFALDIIWIVENKIVQIDKNLLPPAQNNGQEIVVVPQVPITHVLEVNGGWSDRHQISVGDQVVLESQ